MDSSVDDWNKERKRLEDRLITAALELQRHTGSAGYTVPIDDQALQIRLAPASPKVGKVDELESEISEDASQLYGLKNQKYIDIDVPSESGSDPHLFVVIGPDASPPEDEPDERT